MIRDTYPFPLTLDSIVQKIAMNYCGPRQFDAPIGAKRSDQWRRPVEKAGRDCNSDA